MIDLSGLQDAIGQLLADDAGVTAALGSHNGRILADTRGEPVFPYIALGEGDVVDESVQDGPLKRVNFAMSIWTKEGGFTQCKAIEAAAVAALHDASVAAPGLNVVFCHHRVSRFLRDPENGIRQAPIEFVLMVQAST